MTAHLIALIIAFVLYLGQDDFSPVAMEYSEGVPLENAIRAEDKRNAYPVRCVKNESE